MGVTPVPQLLWGEEKKAFIVFFFPFNQQNFGAEEGVLWQGMSFELPPSPNHPFPITPNPLGFHHCCLLGLLQPVLGRNEIFGSCSSPSPAHPAQK